MTRRRLAQDVQKAVAEVAVPVGIDAVLAQLEQWQMLRGRSQ
jgi:hypothetical protein